MREIKTFKVYNLVDAKGNKLRLNLGYIDAPQDKYLVDEHDEGLRWSFEGLKIPMPVRSGYWFNGFPETIMLDWLKGNGWALRTIVNMFTGAARVFELPDVDDKGNEETGMVNEFPIHYEPDRVFFEKHIGNLVRNGDRVAAVRLYRYAHGGNLKMANDAVREIVDRSE